MVDFARKFWMMTSWMWPYRSCIARMANRESTRSSAVSPIPTRRPVVKGILNRPASSRGGEEGRALQDRGAGGAEVFQGPPVAQLLEDRPRLGEDRLGRVPPAEEGLGAAEAGGP